MSERDVDRSFAFAYPFGTAEARDVIEQSCFWQGEAEVLRTSDASWADGREAVVVMGAFDGLHEGHRALVAAAVEDARNRRVPCVAVTFDPDPSELIHPDTPQPHLLSVEDRLRGLCALGVDHTVAIPFTRELAALSPEKFVATKLMDIAHPVAIHVGSNFHFGHHGAGDVATLEALAKRWGFDVRVCNLVHAGGSRVSSTRIRTLLGQPDGLAAANALMHRCHMVRGAIEHGRGEGTSFGFPTANVRCEAHACMPCDGVYGGYVTIGRSSWPAAINVGAPPSFSGPDELFLEANLIGFQGDIYGEAVAVTFVEWLRPSRRFSSLEELERVVLGNIDWVRQNLGEGEVKLS